MASRVTSTTTSLRASNTLSVRRAYYYMKDIEGHFQESGTDVESCKSVNTANLRETVEDNSMSPEAVSSSTVSDIRQATSRSIQHLGVNQTDYLLSLSTKWITSDSALAPSSAKHFFLSSSSSSITKISV
ncbi:SubName: Full=Uncharacterized protein {ECO:0000313/EMBL:CCA76085.1} [Serendipita indica DSM 11827]|nr:SubName: Full=Uncharacterized protein {ECO:0000313/EMBL:CCA76085.1} [Serendipita indica DSM 11827]